MSEYVPTDDELRAIRLRYERHAPCGDSKERHGLVMNAVHDLAKVLLRACPRSVELDHALHYLELAQWSANASIARNEQT